MQLTASFLCIGLFAAIAVSSFVPSPLSLEEQPLIDDQVPEDNVLCGCFRNSYYKSKRFIKNCWNSTKRRVRKQKNSLPFTLKYPKVNHSPQLPKPAVSSYHLLVSRPELRRAKSN